MSTPRFPAIVTAAGAAMRFRPFSATVPKEMLPIGHIPAVEHVITECLAAEVTDVIVVTRPGDHVIPAHIQHLQSAGLPVTVVPENLDHGYGNAAPLLTVRDQLAECGSFAVAFGDDVLVGEPSPGHNLAAMRSLLTRQIEAVIAGQPIDPAYTRCFGVIDTDPHHPDRVTAIRQRPDPDTVTEPLAVVSRLILRPTILAGLVPTELARGEVDLGIAVGALAHGAPVAVHRIAGQWVTVGDPDHYHQALNTHARLTSEKERQ